MTSKKLVNFFFILQKGKNMKINEFYNNIYANGVDGKHHILVSPFGETNIGKFSSLNWRSKFFLPNLGEFTSPINFVYWALTGNENLRHEKTNIKVPREFWELGRLYAKYGQIAALKNNILKNYNEEELERVLNLPWVTYKVHLSGIKERLPDEKYNFVIKEIIKHILLTPKFSVVSVCNNSQVN